MGVTGAVNGDALTETFSTTATIASLVGSYPIVPSVTGGNLGNYNIAATNGTLTISQAGTATTFALSNQNLTLTALVVSLTSGTPTGMVAFYEGLREPENSCFGRIALDARGFRGSDYATEAKDRQTAPVGDVASAVRSWRCHDCLR